ncbi:hypothetical protein D9756_010186 [Leucocoprinus leucothites]|uniref:Uncharacterized protein n=1 Tax=Leucocoprinus leucothites TaxID=201217 RepID=A0A8H5FSF3_9AGAR|nr:hypothetical protein D9756_010186 [Leucoagaricus leucothites]
MGFAYVVFRPRRGVVMNPQLPTTPEQDREAARAEEREQRQMTSPEARREHINERLPLLPPHLRPISPTPAPQQPPNLGALHVLQIPQTYIPPHLNAPLAHPAPLPPPVIPQTVIPEGWNRPLANPLPRNVPPVPVLQHGRGRPIFPNNVRQGGDRLRELEQQLRREVEEREQQARREAEVEEAQQLAREQAIEVQRLAQEDQQRREIEVERQRVAQEQLQMRLEEERVRYRQQQEEQRLRNEEQEARYRMQQQEQRLREQHLQRQAAIVQQELELQERLEEQAEAERLAEINRMMEEWRVEQQENLDFDEPNQVLDEDLDNHFEQNLDQLEREPENENGENEENQDNQNENEDEYEHNEEAQPPPPPQAPSPSPPPLPPRNPRDLPPACRPFNEADIEPDYLGPMNVICSHCNALHFDCEKLAASTVNRPRFGVCCLQGQIRLEPFHPLNPNEALAQYMTRQRPQWQEFYEDIRHYNAAFAMISVGVKLDASVLRGTGAYCFKIQGELHHLAGALLPLEGQTPKYAQIYVHEPEQQLEYRRRNNDNMLSDVVLGELQEMLIRTHPYTGIYKQAVEIMQERPPGQQDTISVKLHVDRQQDQRRYNAPTANKIAVIVPEAGVEEAVDDQST